MTFAEQPVRGSLPFAHLWVPIFVTCVVCGCAVSPVQTDNATTQPQRAPHDAAPVLAVVRGLLGTPYRYGGTTPNGFDCSGLIYYAHQQAGMVVPRTSQEQLRNARPIPLSRLRAGDLVFFTLKGKSHVGMYAGSGQFIHAPSRGKRVSYADLLNPYWRTRLVAAGRFD